MMNSRQNPRSGIVIIDLLLLAIIIVLSFETLGATLRYLDKRSGERCFISQKEIDTAMWDVLNAREKEIAQLTAGYVLHSPGNNLQMVLVFTPPPGKTRPEEAVVDLNAMDFSAKGLCPLHAHPPDQPVIDYWYGAGRWWCLNNKHHN